MPVENRSRFTSAFGKRDIDNGPRDHWGVDFGGPTPGESVFAKAAADGVVEWIKTIPLRSGPAIGIRHSDGSLTTYLHTRRHKVKPGQRVKRGEVIAETWHTGIPLSNGIHLHFEWWKDYRDHRSVFNPIQRLAANGWVIRDGRLYDEQSATITPASTTPEEFTVSQINDIAKATASATAQAVADLRIPVTRSGQPTTRDLVTLVSSIDGQGIHNTAEIAELKGIVEKLAEKAGLTAAEVEAAAVRGSQIGAEKAIAAGIEIEGTVQISKKEK